MVEPIASGQALSHSANPDMCDAVRTMEVMANRWKPDRQNQWFDERLKSALDRYGACQRIPIKARGNTKPHLEAEYTSAPTRHAKPEFK